MLTIQFTLHLLLSALAALMIVILGALLGWVAASRLRIRREREHTIRLDNRGNCRSVFQLTAGSPAPGLRFSFWAGRTPLPGVYLAGEAPEEAQAGGNAPLSPPAGGGKAAEGMDKAVKAGQSVAETAGKTAGFLGGLGALLPGSAGKALKEQADKARFVEMDTLRATRAPGATLRQVRSLRSGMQASAPSRPEKYLGGKMAAPLTEMTFTAQTPEVAAGGSLEVELRIAPIQPRALTGSFPYLLLVEQVAPDYPDLPSGESSRNGIVYFKPVSFWRSALPGVSYSLIALVCLSLLCFSLLKIWY